MYNLFPLRLKSFKTPCYIKALAQSCTWLTINHKQTIKWRKVKYGTHEMGDLHVVACLWVSADNVWLDYGTVTEAGVKLWIHSRKRLTKQHGMRAGNTGNSTQHFLRGRILQFTFCRKYHPNTTHLPVPTNEGWGFSNFGTAMLIGSLYLVQQCWQVHFISQSYNKLFQKLF